MLVLVVLLLSVSTLLFACAPKEEVPTKITPAGVNLESVYKVFGGTESVTHTPVFVITNSNNFEVTVQTLDYRISVDNEVIGAGQIPDPVYIPANTTVKLTSCYTLPLSAPLGRRMMAGAGMTAGAATAATLPLWKMIGGANPAAPLAATWQNLTSQVTYKAEGTVSISGLGMKTTTEYSRTVSLVS